MDIHSLRRDYKEAILAIAAKHHASDIAVFGSIARGNATSESDVDFLVRFDNEASYFDLSRMADELEALLKRKVDLIPSDSIKPTLASAISQEAQPL